jgi:hypothetical protein
VRPEGIFGIAASLEQGPGILRCTAVVRFQQVDEIVSGSVHCSCLSLIRGKKRRKVAAERKIFEFVFAVRHGNVLRYEALPFCYKT